MALDISKAQIDIENFYKNRIGCEFEIPMIEGWKQSGPVLRAALLLGASVDCTISPYPTGGVNVVTTLDFLYKGDLLWTVLTVYSLTPFSDITAENLLKPTRMDAPSKIGEYSSFHTILEEKNDDYLSLVCRDVKTVIHQFL